MDLPNIQTYLRPESLQNIPNWGEDWAWLAGGTWLFSEPQPHLKMLVDIQHLGTATTFKNVSRHTAFGMVKN